MPTIKEDGWFWTIAMYFLILIGIGLFGLMGFAIYSASQNDFKPVPPKGYEYISGDRYLYEMKDTRTGCHYLVRDKGGTSPVVKADGSILCD